MRSEQMTMRSYHDEKNVPVYYLLRNIPDAWDEGYFEECYSIIARYRDGSIRQWYYRKDELKRAFRVFRIMSIDRYM